MKRFTEKEIEAAKHVQAIYGDGLVEYDSGDLCIIVGHGWRYRLPPGLFPSIRNGQVIPLAEVLRAPEN